MTDVMKLIKWGLILACIIAVGIILWMSGLIGPKKSPEIQVAENEIECVAAAALADSKREPGANLDEVRENIAKAVRRYSLVNKTSVCDVFEKGLTMIPVGYKRPGFYLGRRRGYIKMEFTGASWDTAAVMAKRVLAVPEMMIGGCATHYIRADRSYVESAGALSTIREMKSVPKDPKDLSKIEFFCPK